MYKINNAVFTSLHKNYFCAFQNHITALRDATLRRTRNMCILNGKHRALLTVLCGYYLKLYDEEMSIISTRLRVWYLTFYITFPHSKSSITNTIYTDKCWLLIFVVEKTSRIFCSTKINLHMGHTNNHTHTFHEDLKRLKERSHQETRQHILKTKCIMEETCTVPTQRRKNKKHRVIV